MLGQSMIVIQKPGNARVCHYSGAAVFVRGIHVCHPLNRHRCVYLGFYGTVIQQTQGPILLLAVRVYQ